MEIKLIFHSAGHIEGEGKCCLTCDHRWFCAIYLAAKNTSLPRPYTVIFDCLYYKAESEMR